MQHSYRLRLFSGASAIVPMHTESGSGALIGLSVLGTTDPSPRLSFFFRLRLFRFLTCGFCDDTQTGLIVKNPLRLFTCPTEFQLVVVQNQQISVGLHIIHVDVVRLHDYHYPRGKPYGFYVLPCITTPIDQIFYSYCRQRM